MPKSTVLDTHLTDEEQLFVDCYFNMTSDVFGNGTKSVVEAMKDKITRDDGSINYDYAAVKAYELLRTPKIMDAGRKLLSKQCFNDESVDTQHAFLIQQHSDLGVKQRAIDMYNKLQGRYEKDNKQKATSVVLNIDGQDINA